VTEFESALPSDATKKSFTSMEGFSDSPYEAYKVEPTDSLELHPGDVLAVMIDIEGVTATFKEPLTTVDHFGAFINKDRMALIEVSSVAKRDPAIYEYPAVPDVTTPDDTTDEDTVTPDDTDETTTEDNTVDDVPTEDTTETTTPDDTADETTPDTTGDTTDEDTVTPDDTEDTTTPVEPENVDDDEETTPEDTDTTTPDDTVDEDTVTPDDTDDTTTPDDTADEELTPEDPDEPEPVWSPLVAEANADIYPSFAWTVPTNAAIGSKFQLQIDVNKGSSTALLNDNYYGVFQVTVTAPPPSPPVEEEPEDSASSLLITLAIVTAATAVGVACLYFFVI